MLRRLRVEMALARLEEFVRFHAERGTRELIVVVGKGRSSVDGRAVLGPAVQSWCTAHPTWVRSCGVAPPDEGGEGALVLRLDDSAQRTP
jgi:DNA-nicking Smr family endonuclease